MNSYLHAAIGILVFLAAKFRVSLNLRNGQEYLECLLGSEESDRLAEIIIEIIIELKATT